MVKPKFKVGDTVKVLNTMFDLIPVGSLAVVTRYQSDSVNLSEGYDITFNGHNLFYYPYELEAIDCTTVTNSNMGIRLNSGKTRWRNFPMFLMEPVIRVGSFAEKREGNPNGKYETFNFFKGLYVNDCLDSLKRHLVKFESPYEADNDDESQESHLAHIAWNALVALHMLKTRPELDDRYKIEKLTDAEKLEAAEEIQRRGR